jgi:ATP-NAD kinase N-terminal domain
VLVERRVAREFPDYRVFDPCRNGERVHVLRNPQHPLQFHRAHSRQGSYTLLWRRHLHVGAVSLEGSQLLTGPQLMVGADADFCITLGGDGTVLHLTSLFVADEPLPPVVAFAMGTLGASSAEMFVQLTDAQSGRSPMLQPLEVATVLTCSELVS